MLYLERPDTFTPRFEIVSCFVEYAGKILLLLRQDHRSEPNTYGVPAGKVEPWETRDQAMLRELFEETWLVVRDMEYFREVYVQFPEYGFVYHMYRKKLEALPNIRIHPEEHKGYIWRSPTEALAENLIQDEDDCIRMFYHL